MKPSLFLSLLFGISFAYADELTLTDLKGRAIEVTMMSADEVKVVAVRKSDRKEFIINIDQLKPETRKAVEEWRKKVGRLPSKSQSFRLTGQKTKSGEINVRFKLPEGNFNVSSDDSRIKLVHDKGRLEFWIGTPGRTKEMQIGFLEKSRESLLKNMQPADRAEREPHWKIVETAHKDFVGGMVDFCNPPSKSGSSRHFISNKEFFIETTCYYSSGDSVVLPEDVELILGTIEIDSKKSPREQPR